MEAIYKSVIPALEINGEYRIIRKIFEGDRATIDEFLRDDPDEDTGIQFFTPQE
jgi:hypothetical protein